MPSTILLSCESISKAYGVKPLFTDLSLTLFEGDHIGLSDERLRQIHLA